MSRRIVPRRWVIVESIWKVTKLIPLQLRHFHKGWEKEQEAKKIELRQMEDSLIRAKKEVEKQSSKLKEPPSTAGGSDYENLKVRISQTCILAVMC